MRSSELPLEQFAALAAWPHGFIGRGPGVAVSNDKAAVLAALDAVHRRARQQLGLEQRPFATVQQVHEREIAIVGEKPGADVCFEGCDGIITDQRDACLGIYVADCCAVYLVDRENRAIGLVHSGRKGTDLGVVPAAITALQKNFGVTPADLIVQLSPCIRPPHYEVDFAQEIVAQCHAAGVTEIHDCQTCTACDLTKYYSYRAEKGRTGRMLALLGLQGNHSWLPPSLIPGGDRDRRRVL